MSDACRTLLNRLLLSAIGVMTLAIFALGGAIVWKLFLAPPAQDTSPLVAGLGEPHQDSNPQSRSLVSGSAAITYTLPPGCTDQIETGPDSLSILFVGESCANRVVQSIEGNVTLGTL